VFLHPVGSTCHVVHSGASGARNVEAVFFKLMLDRYVFHNKCAGKNYAEPVFFHPVGFAGHVVHSGASRAWNTMHYFSCAGGPGLVSIKTRRDMLRRTSGFISGGIYGSRGAFRCVQGMKRQCTIFHASMGPVRIPQKARWDT
jgi:hypothetical protein